MKLIGLFFALVILMASCSNTTESAAVIVNGFNEVLVKEVKQTSKYTYLLVEEAGTEKWLAAPKTQVQTGKKYYYKGGFEMENFEGEEAGTTFDKIVFLDYISDKPEEQKTAHSKSEKMNPHGGMMQGHGNTMEGHGNMSEGHGAVKVTKKEKLDLTRSNNEISIQELFANKEKYNGKQINVKGKVTKFNELIMDRNWVHIQDGTEHNGEFDLTITTNDKVKVGDIVSFEGTIAIDKDFGYGYKYAIILEKSKVLEEL